MRIITGTARGCKLITLEGENTRPTSERTKEAVFSMLQSEIRGSMVLDLFSGSGQMALEALSRGAEGAVLIDKSAEAVEVIKKNAEKTGLGGKCRIIRGDTLSILNSQSIGQFDLVFADPPYALGLVSLSLEALLNGKMLQTDAKIVCETASFDDVFGKNTALSGRFDIIKQAKYGIAHITVLKYKGENITL